MFSKEFMKYLDVLDVKPALNKAKKETFQMPNSMFYLILKSSGAAPKKA